MKEIILGLVLLVLAVGLVASDIIFTKGLIEGIFPRRRGRKR